MTNSTWERLRSDLSPSSKPIRLVWTSGLADRGRPAIGGAELRKREIHLDHSLRSDPAELERILAHELFHFVWVRIGNLRRTNWKTLLQKEIACRAKGELGWSSEWRKARLPAGFAAYSCEAFCDTGAWILTGCTAHDEVTLARRWRNRRAAWFRECLPPPWNA